jgi:hypothetical protein
MKRPCNRSQFGEEESYCIVSQLALSYPYDWGMAFGPSLEALFRSERLWWDYSQ